jgi:hypothetical protein
VGVGYQPPHHREHQPRAEEVEREHQQRPAPLGVHQRREDVLEVLAPPLGNVRLHHVAVAMFEHHPLADTTRVEAGLLVPDVKQQIISEKSTKGQGGSINAIENSWCPTEIEKSHAAKKSTEGQFGSTRRPQTRFNQI